VKLSFSNLAWERADDRWVAELLCRHGIKSIDLTPAKYFTPGEPVDEQAVRAVRAWWAGWGIDIAGMQALFHGTTGFNLFGDAGTRQRMLAHLQAMCRIGAALGAPRLTFGAPRVRDRGLLSEAEAAPRAMEFFRELGGIAQAHQVTICLEPVPASLGGNFMTDTTGAAGIVLGTRHPAIRLQLDLGSITTNGEDLGLLLRQVAPLVGHVHLSEPALAPLGAHENVHAPAAKLLREFLPDRILTIEMLSQAPMRREQMERALGVALRHYGD